MRLTRHVAARRRRQCREIFDALCRLLAPILAFTAEEAWGYLGAADSVHLQLFPEPRASARDTLVRSEVERLLALRGVIGQVIEKARQEKLIGNALEAEVTLHCDARIATAFPREELEEFFILSDLKLETAEEPRATVARTAYLKCGRCWRHRAAVGTIEGHPDLCERCAEVVEALA